MSNVSQREMPFLAVVAGPKEVPQEFITACKSELDAVKLCIQLSEMSQEAIGDKLGIDKGHFTRMLQGRANFPTKKRLTLMNLCGNLAPIQYEAWKVGRDLVERSKDVRIRELEQQLQQLRAA